MVADGRVQVQKGVGRPYFSCLGAARTDSVGKRRLGWWKVWENNCQKWSKYNQRELGRKMSSFGMGGRHFGMAETLGKANVGGVSWHKRCLEEFLGRRGWGIWDLQQKSLRIVGCEGQVRVTVWEILLSGPWQMFLSGPDVRAEACTQKTASLSLCKEQPFPYFLLVAIAIGLFGLNNPENTRIVMKDMNFEWSGELLCHMKIHYMNVDLRDWNLMFLNLFHTASVSNKSKFKTRHSSTQWPYITFILAVSLNISVGNWC